MILKGAKHIVGFGPRKFSPWKDRYWAEALQKVCAAGTDGKALDSLFSLNRYPLLESKKALKRDGGTCTNNKEDRFDHVCDYGNGMQDEPCQCFTAICWYFTTDFKTAFNALQKTCDPTKVAAGDVQVKLSEIEPDTAEDDAKAERGDDAGGVDDSRSTEDDDETAPKLPPRLPEAVLLRLINLTPEGHCSLRSECQLCLNGVPGSGYGIITKSLRPCTWNEAEGRCASTGGWRGKKKVEDGWLKEKIMCKMKKKD